MFPVAQDGSPLCACAGAVGVVWRRHLFTLISSVCGWRNSVEEQGQGAEVSGDLHLYHDLTVKPTLKQSGCSSALCCSAFTHSKLKLQGKKKKYLEIFIYLFFFLVNSGASRFFYAACWTDALSWALRWPRLLGCVSDIQRQDLKGCC